jgi:hypothetical protein
VRRECEEYAQRRGGVDGPPEPDAHGLDFWHRGLVPTDEGRFRAGRGGQGDGRWKNGRIGVAVCVVAGGQRGQVVRGSLVLCKLLYRAIARFCGGERAVDIILRMANERKERKKF